MPRAYFDLSWTKILDEEMKTAIAVFFELVRLDGWKARLCEDEQHYELFDEQDRFVSRRTIKILTLPH